MQSHHAQSVGVYLLTGLLTIVVLAPRLRGMGRTRRLDIGSLWMTPAQLAAITGLSLIPQPPKGPDYAWLAGGLVLGAALGWWRGKMMHISVDPETGVLYAKPSPAAVVVILALSLTRMALPSLSVGEASVLHLPVSMIMAVFMIFALGALGVQHLEMALRANRLLGEARAAKAT